MQLIKREFCPVCKKREFIPFKKSSINTSNLKPDSFKITDNEYGNCWNFSRCDNCTFVFSNPHLKEKDLIEFYSQLEDKEYSFEARGRGKNFIKILNRLKKIEINGNMLLDIGAASGIFLNLAKKRGYQTEGIEPSRSLCKQAGKLFGIKLFQGTLDQYSSQEKFSIITLLDIIEHIQEPETFIRQVSSHMGKGGILVIVTPDINSVASKFMGKKWWHCE